MNLRGFCAADFGASSPTQTCTVTWAISTVADVRSLNFQLHVDACASAWELAKSKIIKAQKTKAQTYQDVGSRIPASQKEVVDQLLNKVWGYDITHLLGGDWNTLRYYSILHESTEKKHDNLIGQLLSSDLNGFKQDMNEFKTEFRKFGDKYEIYGEERNPDIGYNRFDKYYTDPKLQDILNKIPLIAFTPAEIKALQMQETGDFCKTTIAGLNKQQGIKDNVNTSGTGIVGICQLPLESARDAAGWGKVKNVGAALMEERTILPNALFLTPAYLGKILEILDNGNTIPPNTACLDKKRLVFASYNAGPGTLKLAITACLKVKKEVQWSDTTFQNCLATVLVNLAAKIKWDPAKKLIEVNNYVKFIEKRLQ